FCCFSSFLLLDCIAQDSCSPPNLLQFRQIIKCTNPHSKPLEQYNQYGCYCGFGGTGTPVDELDM
uniref:Phospholipase A2 n=1 Tax=Leptobrachium leishanense TaxID=445787 RepID=A0A8C5MFA1_9ANUR